MPPVHTSAHAHGYPSTLHLWSKVIIGIEENLDILTNMKAWTVVYLREDYQEQYSTVSKPGTRGAGPRNLTFNKLTWWFDANITLRALPELPLCATDANKQTWGCQLSYYSARRGLGWRTSQSKAGFASKEENDLYLVFIWHGSGTLLFKNILERGERPEK